MARPLKEDLTGKRFGKLFVIRRDGSITGQAMWLCKCDCGVECRKPGSAMRLGRIKSCGCWRIEMPTALKTTHGFAGHKGSRSRLYTLWNGMKQRCHNPNQKHYPRYGGLGIKVCEEWRNSFEAFYRDMGDPPKDGQRWSLDRIDVYKGYEPENVRWATYKQQNDPNNKRQKLFVQEVIAEVEKRITNPEQKAEVLKILGDVSGKTGIGIRPSDGDHHDV